jgi:hypothetical protein
MAKYGIATLFENLQVGYEFSQDNIPLHLTHVDSFQIEKNASELAVLLSESAADLSPINIRQHKILILVPPKIFPSLKFSLARYCKTCIQSS